MFDKLLQIVAPHHCYSCQQSGLVLCNGCADNIIYDTHIGCIGCEIPTVSGVCRQCRPGLAFSAGWVATARDGSIKQLLNDYKFSRLYSAHRPLADLLEACLPLLPLETQIVPIPTIPHHIRVRGYDHTMLIARHLARRRGLECTTLLKRKTDSVQVGAGKHQRLRQAKEAFYCPTLLSADVPYLIVDDIITTGATVQAAAQCLKNAGARHIMVAAVARS